mmetsp:Transcript_37976/g.27964  ORF Transcript_37976/g.27964 Transcript_37976/m.27964 type:complete len:111 (+) Transcript_37976:279-611(+)
MQGRLTKPKDGVADYLSKDYLDKLWNKNKAKIDDQNFLKVLKNFDIRKVNKYQIQHVQRLFENDPWMSFSCISRESNFSAYLFLWVLQIVEYISIAQKLRRLGMKQIETK